MTTEANIARARANRRLGWMLALVAVGFGVAFVVKIVLLSAR